MAGECPEIVGEHPACECPDRAGEHPELAGDPLKYAGEQPEMEVDTPHT